MAKAKAKHASGKDRGREAFRILQIFFIVAPIVVGIDKFFYFLTNWSNYLSPLALKIFAGQDRAFMSTVGIIEIIAGIGVAFKPKLFGYIISLYLLGVILNLLMTGRYFDIGLRDVGLMLSVFCMARLSSKYSH